MASPIQGEVIFTVEEAATFAKVTPQTVRRWFDMGLRHFPTANNKARSGPRREIVRLSSLLAFIEANEVGARLADLRPEAAPAANRRAAKGAVAADDPFNLMGRTPRRRG